MTLKRRLCPPKRSMSDHSVKEIFLFFDKLVIPSIFYNYILIFFRGRDMNIGQLSAGIISHYKLSNILNRSQILESLALGAFHGHH